MATTAKPGASRCEAIPVLNEWHRRQPAADPVKLEWDRFASDVYCPGGKGYRWNERAMTMESVAIDQDDDPRDRQGDRDSAGRCV
jgi:hypothetical protein